MSKLYLAIFFIVAALTVGGVLVLPKYQSLNTINKEIESREIELQSKVDYFTHIKGLESQLQEYEEPLAKINSALPNDPLLPSTFNYLQVTASQTGLIIEEVLVGSAYAFGSQAQTRTSSVPAVESDIKATDISVSLSGSYQSLKSFISEIEKSARLIEIQKISFESPKEEDEGLFLFSISMVIYNN
jgi:Tfp pilus assembly protein PilO